MKTGERRKRPTPRTKEPSGWYSVWLGPYVDHVTQTPVRAKKHAAWLSWLYRGSTWWRHRVTITLKGEDIPFDDYEFRDGESRRIRKPHE